MHFTIGYKWCDLSMPDYTLLPFPIFFYLKSFSLIQVPNTLPVQYIPRPYLFISTASLPPIQSPYIAYINLHQQGVKMAWTFVLEEFGYNVPDYISSLDRHVDKIMLWNKSLLKNSTYSCKLLNMQYTYNSCLLVTRLALTFEVFVHTKASFRQFFG